MEKIPVTVTYFIPITVHCFLYIFVTNYLPFGCVFSSLFSPLLGLLDPDRIRNLDPDPGDHRMRIQVTIECGSGSRRPSNADPDPNTA
jgi:hypothetical protein